MVTSAPSSGQAGIRAVGIIMATPLWGMVVFFSHVEKEHKFCYNRNNTVL
jgi:hypothetical protein